MIAMTLDLASVFLGIMIGAAITIIAMLIGG